MITEIGHYALVLALAVAVVISIVPFFGARKHDDAMMRMGSVGFFVLFTLVALSFLALVDAYIVSDFSVKTVWENSHSKIPLLYKISGVWGNHEGSMMLWLLILCFFGMLVAGFGQTLPQNLKAYILSVQAWIATAFILFILLTSNPFARLSPAPLEGQDLNPILQDPGLAIHPPLLYLGYVGFSVCFSFAVAALIDGRIDAAWARWVRPWALASWTFLTVGIAMGSYWAYYELGWGGWWFWDPVENASFMPWLAGTALLHSALVMEKRAALKIWTVLLSILSFSLSLLGTFLVRSGLLTSVHAFASDPSRGIFILGILTLFIGGALTLFAWRAPRLSAGGLFAPLSREGALVFNNLVLMVACGTILVGTLYPLVLETLTGDKISVGPPFFNLTFGLLMAPLLLVVPFGPFLSWKRADLYGVFQRLYVAASLALLCAIVVFYMQHGGPVMAVLGLAAGLFLVFGSIADLFYRAAFLRVSTGLAWRRLIGLPRSSFGTALAHMGLGFTVLGIVAVTTFQTETVVQIKPGQSVETGQYSVHFEKIEQVSGSNYTEDRAQFTILSGGVSKGKILPAKRFYSARQMPTTEAGIFTSGFSQLYVSLGDVSEAGTIVVRIWWKPFILLIWSGAILMAFGGVISLSDRRLRVGAPGRKKLVSTRWEAAE